MSNPINIIGIGKSLPNNEVTSLSIDKKLGLASGTVYQLTGLQKRYFLDDKSNSLDLVFNAVAEALRHAKLCIDDIDCIINSSATMEQAIPYNGASTHRLLNPSRPIPSFDINMTCLSTLRAFDIASNLFSNYNNILIVSCDIASVGLDWNNIRTAGIFGDGACAMIVTSSNSGGIIVSNFETHSKGYEYCMIKGGGSKYNPNNYKGDYKDMSYFEMNGKNLYKLSSKILPSFIDKTLKSKGLKLDDIDWIVPHQASQSSLNHIVKMLNIDKEKFIDIFKTHGNQVSSSIPSALHTLMHTKELISGQKVMLVGTSAGVGLGLVVWEIP
ncbi:3-oxoacyl-[acyl-carrier-protein] synthase III C-terminal domain-containing protein [Sulfurimonas sp.]|uniref:3-oxoacyl-[acyl-carrier-protein] synthase III C-terminal domain-containing protein n=1 Tax=Sulfurimonas sp. TaxID=2022749 RepID=UPI002638BC82|nr:3-oxoacyl-[acyl-carrier-protein] synthase III C-terminal domain-containing protein [Sulfurimonas sp.]MCW8895461.1 hypothetical protein [Sulfurimonas sp.]